MSEGREQPTAADRARLFLLQAVALFAAMILPLAALDGYQGPIGAAVVLAVYTLGGILLGGRGKPDGDKVRGGFRVGLAALIIFASGFMAVSGIAGTAIVAWLHLAYTPFEIQGAPVLPRNGDIVGGLSHTLTLLAGGIVWLALGILLLHWGRGGLGVLAGRMRRHGPGLFLSPWLSETASLMLLFGCSVFLVVTVPLEMLVDAMSLGRQGTFLAAAETFPFLMLGLASTAVLAVAMVNLVLDYSPFEDIVRALREDDVKPKPRDAWWPALATITLGAAAGTVGATLWALHIGLLAAAASVPALLAATTVGGDLDVWATAQHGTGLPRAELVATVNNKRFWIPEEPDRGLAELMPKLVASLDAFGLQPGCRATVAAAAATPEDSARPLPDVSDWRPLGAQGLREPEEAEGSTDRFALDEREAPPLRYCVKVTCPVPVAWQAPPALALYSSNPSDNTDWMTWIYFDLFTRGAASASGGYCTASGELADDFQG